MRLSIGDVPVAILAGGLGTRLRPLTDTLPKALIEVAGRPFIDHQLALLREKGVRRVVLCLGHGGDQVEARLGRGDGFGLEVAYSYDGDRLLGTAGALRRAANRLGDAFWVLYGDSYLDIDYAAVLAAFSRHDRALCLMTVLRNDNRWDQSNVEFADGRLVAYDKKRPSPRMRHIDFGASLLVREALERIPADQPADLGDLFTALVAEGRMVGYEVTQRFYEIGSPEGLEETSAYLLSRQRSAHTREYIRDAADILARLDLGSIERTINLLVELRQRGGRLFILGVGGSAANASHAVNDFRKIAHIEAYAPTDNVAELTARINDDGWETVFVNWLRGSRFSARDMLFVLSVGGGDLQRNISPNLVRAVEYAKQEGGQVCGIVGRTGGFTATAADACVIVPPLNQETVTPHTESFQAVIWHLMVSHPALRAADMKWESVR